MNDELEKFELASDLESSKPKDLKMILDFSSGVSAFHGKPMEIDIIKYRTKSTKLKKSEVDLSKRRKEKSTKNDLF
jgi:hypothetical protein